MGLTNVEEKLARMADTIEALRKEVAENYQSQSNLRTDSDVYWRKRCEGLDERIKELEDIVAKRPARLPMLGEGGHS